MLFLIRDKFKYSIIIIKIILLSIIIISKNEENYLPRLLASIKRQNFKDFEIILSDAQSSDKTKDIAKLFDVRITRGGVPGVGRNNGALKAKGDLLLFLDADVELTNNFLTNNFLEFKKRKLDLATVDYKPISYQKKDLISHFLYNLFQRFTQHFFPIAAGFCIFCKKDLFNKINGFDINFKMGEDIDFIQRATKYGKFRVLNSNPIFVDVRRLENDGRWNTLKKYVKGYIYYIKNGNLYEPPFDYEFQGGVNIKKINTVHRQRY